MDGEASLYGRDFVAWAHDQAARLRAAAHERSNLPIEWEAVAEEIEGLANRDERELQSRLTRIIEHILKLQCTSAEDPGRLWTQSIIKQRNEIEALLEQSPSLRTKLPTLMAKADRAAVRLVRNALEGKLRLYKVDAAEAVLAARTDALSEDRLLGDWFPVRPIKAEATRLTSGRAQSRRA